MNKIITKIYTYRCLQVCAPSLKVLALRASYTRMYISEICMSERVRRPNILYAHQKQTTPPPLQNAIPFRNIFIESLLGQLINVAWFEFPNGSDYSIYFNRFKLKIYSWRRGSYWDCACECICMFVRVYVYAFMRMCL